MVYGAGWRQEGRGSEPAGVGPAVDGAGRHRLHALRDAPPPGKPRHTHTRTHTVD